MKTIVLFFTVSICVISYLKAQQVVASAGNSNSVNGITVDWTLGEPVIETIGNSEIILTQGMQQSGILVTNLNEIKIPGVVIKVYPNPVNDLIHIEVIQDEEEFYFCELSDIKGGNAKYKMIVSNPQEIDMSKFKPGIYVLRVLNKRLQSVKVYKLIKQ